MKLTDLTGEVSISSHHARSFVAAWFSPEDKIVLVGQKTEKTGKLDTISQSMLASEFSEVTDEDIENLVFTPDGTKYNLYIGVCPIKEDVGLQKRGKEDNVMRVPGVWADLDVKENSFGSRDEILHFLFGLELKPSIVVASGSGGIHAYWKLADGETGTKDLVEYWWSHLDESAGPDVKIDKLADLTRILRVPGSVYFPKKDSGSKVGKVEILYLTGNEFTVEKVREVSKEAYTAKYERRKRLINDDANRRVDMDRFARDLLAEGNRWTMYRAISELEDFVNNHMSWAEILEPHGWTFMRQLSDGSNEWARPGRSERSAVVDFEGSPVMSLLSSSDETGLADIKDAQIPITKYRCLLRLWFNDDEKEMVEYLIGRLKEEGII